MKSLRTHHLLLPVFLFLLPSCANYKYNLASEVSDWETQQPDPALQLSHTMYLVGDAGYAKEIGESTPVLSYLKKNLPAENKNSSIIFLGDNIYPNGLDGKNNENRPLSEHRLKVQLELLDEFAGIPVFIPGNHDWKQGLKGLKRQQKYVDKYVNKLKGVDDDDDDDWEDYFLPQEGCPGPEVIEIGKKLVIVVVDSQWWLEDWDKQPKINDDCLAKSRTMFQYLFLNALKKYRSRNVVIAMHHPLYTNGPHGGNFTAKQHLFPLTELNKNLYLPLPGVGSIYALLRGTIGSKQDTGHQLYRDMRDGMMAAATTFGNFIFVSGHEHNLQYLENKGQKFVVSGSGSKLDPSRLGRGAKFAYGTSGFSTLKFYENGEVWTEFYQVNKKEEAKLVFRHKVKGELDIIEENIPDEFPEFEAGKDSAVVNIIQNKVLDAGPVHKLFLGDHHRNVYMEKYKFPVLDLTKFDGGVEPVKRGGGSQTNSLRLENPRTGKQYAMRAVTKDVSRILPYPINKMTAAKLAMEDFFLSSHPFAATAIPPMASAINIYHTQPNYYYVPKQPALGVNNDIFGGDVYLLEERPAGDWSDASIFGGSEKIMSTFDVSEKITKNNNHKVDQAWALRSRLFDQLIGDFDRHDDQWRWARFEEDGKKIYRPVPRDRDQPFSKYDGVLVFLARVTTPFMRQLRVYGPKINSIRYLAWSSLAFDNSFITELEWADWVKEIEFIQQNLTDEVIDQAFEAWPEKADQLTGEHIRMSLKKRRDDLKTYAREFYEILSKEVDVHGTDERELFEVERIDDERTRVSVWEISNKKGKKKEKVYERIFERSVTKEVHLYGIGDDDEFRVTGDVSKGIKVRCVGGLGNDTFVDESKVAGACKKTFFYDDLRKNELNLGTEARDMRSNDRELNLYDRRSVDHEYDFLTPLPVIGRNPDDGFLVGFSGIVTTYKFRKIPYSTLHTFRTSYAFATKAFNAEYVGDYLNRFGEWDFWLEGRFRTPSYAFNYFGFGNDSKKPELDNQDELDFYRVRQSDLYIHPAFKRRVAGNGGFFRFGPVFQMTDIEATEGRFITSEDAGLDLNEDFERKFFAGAELGFDYLSLDNLVAPKRGVHLMADLGYRNNLDQTERRVIEVNTEMSIYQPLDRKENVVFVTRFGFGHNISEDFDFFQAQRLGGGQLNNQLRGYRADRFFGKTSYWQNLDLRAKLFSSYNQTLPFTFGIFGSFDYGRVWVEDDTSDTWHHNYGGGIFIAPVDILTMSLGAYQPSEDNEDGPRVIFKMGFGF